MFRFDEDAPHIFPDDADAQKLHAPQKENYHDEGGEASHRIAEKGGLDEIEHTQNQRY